MVRCFFKKVLVDTRLRTAAPIRPLSMGSTEKKLAADSDKDYLRILKIGNNKGTHAKQWLSLSREYRRPISCPIDEDGTLPRGSLYHKSHQQKGQAKKESIGGLIDSSGKPKVNRSRQIMKIFGHCTRLHVTDQRTKYSKKQDIVRSNIQI